MPLVAVIVNVYDVPAVNPLTAIGLDDPVPVMLPGELVTVYPVIALPPLLPGAVKGMLAVVPDLVTVPIVGAPGTVVGVTLLLAELDDPVPTPLVATTVNVYAVPAVNPLTVIGLDDPEAVIPPGELVTV